MDNLGLYIHIPFCIKKCIYCDFLSFQGRYEFAEKYIFSLCEEIKGKSELCKGKNIDTIFIGGGTPSSIDSSLICHVLETVYKYYSVDKNCEISIESNPGTLTENKCKDYFLTGINRISLGLQSADDKILNFLGRIHTFDQYLEAVSYIRQSGIDNVNTDLIFGIPGQSMESFEETLCKVFSLDIQHISAYSLIPEEGTKLYTMLDEKTVCLPDDSLDREMYHYVKQFLLSKGYKHYEISNFAKPGFESKHNLKYWEEKEYLGLGLGAASFYRHKRTKNTTVFKAYIEGKNALEEDIFIDDREEKNEYMMLGFRKIKGPDPLEFHNRYGIYVDDLYGKVIRNLLDKKLIETEYIHGKISSVRLSDYGLDFANEVFEEFI